MGIMDKLMNTFTTVDDEEMESEKPLKNSNGTSEGKPVTGLTNHTKMVLFEPRSFEDCEDIANHLKNRRATVINVHRLPKEYSQRTIDFLTGVIFALDGTIKKVGHNVILCTPSAADVAGEIAGQEETSA